MILWQEKVIRRLLAAGYEGVPLSQLLDLSSTNKNATAEALHQFLESLRAEGGVQRFRVDGGRYWRATDKLPDLV